MLIHPFAPVIDRNATVLILGSFPSVQSRERQFYYGNPQNRFWRVLAALFDTPLPQTIEEKRTLLLSHGIALWDVLQSCELTGSADSSIRNAVPNDLSALFRLADLRRIYLNGKTAAAYFKKTRRCSVACEAVCLPSTSAANAAWSLPRLVEAWRVITQGGNDCRTVEP